jgi:hypothetical protein
LPHPPCTNCRLSSSQKPRGLLANLSSRETNSFMTPRERRRPSPRALLRTLLVIILHVSSLEPTNR